MKKKIAVILTIFMVTPVILIGAIYLALSLYYADSFMFGVFVNGVYATGKTPEEINERLMENKQYEKFIIRDKSGNDVEIAFTDIGYTYSYLKPLKELHRKQNPFMWLKQMEAYEDHTITPGGTFDKEKFEKVFGNLEMIKTASDKNKLVVEIKKTSGGYELIDTTTNLINRKKAEKCVTEALKDGVYEIDLLEKECYEDFDYTSQMKETLALYEKIEGFTSGEITYLFDTEEVVIDKKVTSDWILLDESGEFVLDEQGQLMLDETAVKQYVETLAKEYDTVNRDRKFMSTRGDEVVVPAGTYGNRLDVKKETEYLTRAFMEKRTEEHMPSYSQRAWGSGENDIGDTYIEVDLTNQMLYYYKNGIQMLHTDVVTGNTSRGNGTPAKACYIYFMQRNRVLRGEDYETPVNYWMAVYGNIGIHDANWRGRFGGKIYRTNGSHGCINTPISEVKKLYQMVEIGTPVMIFY